MVKFAKNNKGHGPIGKTVNHEGGEAFKLKDEETLLNRVSCCLMNEPKFYEEKGKAESDIFKLAMKVEPEFILKLALYTRSELHLRSVSIYLLAIAAYRNDSKPFVAQYASRIIQRADEINEVLSAYINLFGKPIPNCLKKGVAKSFETFNAYQFGKYNRKGSVSFRDAMCITHPKEPQEILKKIMNGTLETPMTWETQISAKGNKAEVWGILIEEQKLPFMAMLRNLRNMLEAGIGDSYVTRVLNTLTDAQSIRNSGQLPFRFWSAYRAIENVKHPRASQFMDALDYAILTSFENFGTVPGTTMIACDVSGSMDSKLSDHSDVCLRDVGLLLGCAAHKFMEKPMFGCFGDAYNDYNIPKFSSGIISNVDKICQKAIHDCGQSTNGFLVIRALRESNQKVDRIIIFTDCELYDSSPIIMTNMGYGRVTATINKEYQAYRKDINPNVTLYLVNLAGMGLVNFPRNDKSVVNLNGWSDNIFKFIQHHETDTKAQLKYIKEKY